jgi:hypothetical protein
MENVATYSEARSEYTKQLATFIVPSLVGWFQQLWSRNAPNKSQCMALFQSECEEIPRWNQDRIHDEVRVLIERTGCDYMEDLMTAVFIAHTKVLTAVRLSKREKKLSITVPKLDHFVHRVFRESARAFWKSPYLFMETGGVVDRQKNVLQIEALATEAITTAVRSMLPVKQILKDYMEEDDQEEIEDDDMVPAEESVPPPPTPETPASQPPSSVQETPITTQETPIATQETPTTTTQIQMTDVSENQSPSVVKIDTEPSVSFSDYDTVFGNTPEMQYAPKTGNDDDDDDDGPSDTLRIDEASTSAIGDDDVEDLDGPKQKSSGAAADESIFGDSDMVVLE